MKFCCIVVFFVGLVMIVIGVGMVLVEEFVVCCDVVFVDVGWMDIFVMMGLVLMVLIVFGYKIEIKIFVLFVIYMVMVKGDVDIFFGNWMFSQEGDLKFYCDSGMVEVVCINLIGVKYIFVINEVGVKLGIDDFSKIVVQKDVLDGKIFGIEFGNDGNCLLLEMVVDNKFDLGMFEIVEFSEQGMLVQVVWVDNVGQFVVFLGWVLYLMNNQFKMIYFVGGDDIFGFDFGGVWVDINVCMGYVGECFNVGKFL